MYSANRAYTATVCVRGQPVREVHHRGRTYIEGRKGSEYTLKFRNDSTARVMVIASVDGLSVCDGKPAGINSPGYVVDPLSEIEIPGWMIDQTRVAAFKFWPQDRRDEGTYAEELRREGANVDLGNQGLIGFLVIGEKTPPLSYRGYGSFRSGPISASAASWHSSGLPETKMLSSNPSDLGTGFGREKPHNVSVVSFERGRVEATLEIEYDTMAGLKDRGVPVNMLKTDQGPRTAFPASPELSGCKPPKRWRG